MNTKPTLTRRRLFIAAITTVVGLATTGMALADACRRCGGTGTSSMTCISCRGTGNNNGMKCTTCRGTGFMKCPNCNGTGK